MIHACIIHTTGKDEPLHTHTYLIRERPNVLFMGHAHERGRIVHGNHLERGGGGPGELLQEDGEARDEGRGTLYQQGHDHHHQEELQGEGLSLGL